MKNITNTAPKDDLDAYVSLNTSLLCMKKEIKKLENAVTT